MSADARPNPRDPARLEAQVYAALRDLTEGKNIAIGSESPLVGEGSMLDARMLIELCLMLEDLASDVGFQFDWSSEAAAPRPNGMFRNVGSLAAAFVRQASRKSQAA
jgi:hypothetical protein